MIDPFMPQHMDRYSRNERLYRFLLNMGLVVHPIRIGDDPSKIDHLYVSVEPSADGVGTPTERTLGGTVVDLHSIPEG
jgi:hypothetical protein